MANLYAGLNGACMGRVRGTGLPARASLGADNLTTAQPLLGVRAACRPPVVEGAKKVWAAQRAGLVGRVEFVGGDFFSAVPAADV